MTAFAFGGGRCGKERPAEEGTGRRQLPRRLETGKKPLPFSRNLAQGRPGNMIYRTDWGHLWKTEDLPMSQD
jgi:hypothetical protein